MNPTRVAAPAGRYLSWSEREEIAALTHAGVGVREIARRLGRNPDTDLLPRLIFHASRAVTASAVELLAHGAEPSEDASSLIRQGFSQLRDGLHPAGDSLIAAGF